VAVGRDYEETRRKFCPLVEAAKVMGVSYPEKKVLYAEYNK